MKSCQQIVTSLSFTRFIANLERCRSRIQDEWSVIFIFSLISTFYLTKTENRTNKFLTQLSYYYLKEKYYFCRKCYFYAKNADISKIKGVLVLKGIFFSTYISVYLYTKFHVSSIILTSFRQGRILLHPLQSERLKRPLKLAYKINKIHTSEFSQQKHIFPKFY